MQSEQHQDIYGRCYCGAIQFSITDGTKPHWAGFCHCRDCRQAHAAPIYQYVYVEKSCFKIVEGADLLKWYTRNEALRNIFKRYFCSVCGSRVYNDSIIQEEGKELELCGTFPSLFDDQQIATDSIWSPKEHVYCAESIVGMSMIQDGLPQFDST
jgi:hypothetical protein